MQQINPSSSHKHAFADSTEMQTTFKLSPKTLGRAISVRTIYGSTDLQLDAANLSAVHGTKTILPDLGTQAATVDLLPQQQVRED